jgi:hypothetical protein
MNIRPHQFPVVFILLLLLCTADHRSAYAGSKIGTYGIHMISYEDDGKDYSHVGLGGGSMSSCLFRDSPICSPEGMNAR